MTRPLGLSQWQQIVSTQLSHLRWSPATVLALGSRGIVLAQRSGLTSVAVVLAALRDRTVCAVREQLHDGYRDADHQRGARRGDQRRTLVVETCFAPLLHWVVTLLPPTSTNWRSRWTPPRWVSGFPC